MDIGRTASESLKLSGWEQRSEISQEAIESLEENSTAAISLFGAVSEIYEIFHQPSTGRWMVITDGASAFTVNAEAMLIASPNPERLDTEDEGHKHNTMVFTIGLDTKTVADWLLWVGIQRNYPLRRPDRGFNYVS